MKAICHLLKIQIGQKSKFKSERKFQFYILIFSAGHHGEDHEEMKRDRLKSNVNLNNIKTEVKTKRGGASHKYIETGLFMDYEAYNRYKTYFNQSGVKNVDQ